MQHAFYAVVSNSRWWLLHFHCVLMSVLLPVLIALWHCIFRSPVTVECKILWSLHHFLIIPGATIQCLLLWERTWTTFAASSLPYLEQQRRILSGQSACALFTPHCQACSYVQVRGARSDRLLGSTKPGHLEPIDCSSAKKTDVDYQGKGWSCWM